MKLGEAIDQVLQRIDELSLGGAPECYAVSEAVWRLAGGRESGLRVKRIPIEGERWNHWFLVGPFGEIIDLTAGQFDGAYPDYRKAIGAAFYPQVSKKAQLLMDGAA